MESEKATLEVTAPASGIIEIIVKEGEEVEVGAVIGRIDETAAKPKTKDERPKTKDDVLHTRAFR